MDIDLLTSLSPGRLHAQAFEVDAAFSLGLLRGARIRAFVTKAESWLMRRFDVVSTISKRMHELLLRKGVPAPQAKLAVNWVNMASFALPSAAGVAAYRQELQVPPGAVVALYSGNMGGKQGLEVLADVVRLLAQEARHPGTDLATVVHTCGLVVPPENAAALAQAIQTLAADPALRESLGAAGYLYAQAHLDSEAVLGRFESDLRELVGGLSSVTRLGV